ncbi:hypothetical protein [Deinococcus aluminii]|uniref:hypothetical protein n=1 Tax=Deinococcus aluminii TaxID=1656885 RepID=UPI0031E7EEBB
MSLVQEGWVEEVRPSSRSFHILVQQMLCEALRGRHTPASLWAILRGAPPFMGISDGEYREILAHLVQTDILALIRGELTIGDKGESIFGHAGFRDLLAAFDAAHEYTVRDALAQAEVGRAGHDFVLQLEDNMRRGLPSIFLLGGRPWRVVHIDHGRSQVDVRPSEGVTPPIRNGASRRQMSERLARRHLELLCGHPRPAGLNTSAHASLDALRKAHPYLHLTRLSITRDAKGLIVHSFAGQRIHVTLASLLSPYGTTEFDALTIHLTPFSEGHQNSALLWLEEDWRKLGPEEVADALQSLPSASAGKFLRHLPPRITHQHLLETLTDWYGLKGLQERNPIQIHSL